MYILGFSSVDALYYDRGWPFPSAWYSTPYYNDGNLPLQTIGVCSLDYCITLITVRLFQK